MVFYTNTEVEILPGDKAKVSRIGHPINGQLISVVEVKTIWRKSQGARLYIKAQQSDGRWWMLAPESVVFVRR